MMYEVKYRTMNAMGRYEEFHRCYCDAPQYHGGWMEECYLTVNVSEAEPVDFHIGDFISYRGEEFYINYDPHTIKQARRKSTGDSFKYDNIKFYYLGERLKDIQFLDYVLNDNNKAYSSLPTFSFFADSVEDYADRLQANLDRATDFVTWMVLTPSWMRCQQRCGDVEDAWTRYYNADGSGDYGTWGGEAVVKGNRELNVDVQNTNCWDSLKLSYSKFGLSYFIVGESMTVGHGYIIIGAPPIVVDRVFQYGKGMGLYQIERLPDDDKQIITKLYAYGSEANLPLNYYANIGKKAFVMGVRDIITTGGPPYEYGLKTYNSRSKFARSIKRNITDVNRLIFPGICIRKSSCRCDSQTADRFPVELHTRTVKYRIGPSVIGLILCRNSADRNRLRKHRDRCGSGIILNILCCNLEIDGLRTV